ncbi:hypothetical protein [Nonomuraea dietziae]
MALWLESEATPPVEGEPHLEAIARQAFQSGLSVLLDGIEAAPRL